MYSVTIKTKTTNTHSEVDTLKQVAGLLWLVNISANTIKTILFSVKKAGYCEWNVGALHIEINKRIYPIIEGDKTMTLADVEALANGDGE